MKNEKTTAKTNETIWLFVADEENVPMATKIPERKIKPINDPQKAPESTFPSGSAMYETLK